MEETDQQEFQRRIGRIESLVASMDALADPAARAAARELVQCLLDLHGAGLERIVAIARESPAPGEGLIGAFGNDELVGSLLLLHGLHPLDLTARVERALAKVRPYLHSHGGNVELLGVSLDGEVRLKLQGSCHGCPSSQATLQSAITQAIEAAAPDVTALHVEGVVEEPPAPEAVSPSGFVPLSKVLESSSHSRRIHVEPKTVSPAAEASAY